ncbi:MAG: phosphotransferase family protein [Caulobacterales bacterium]
MDNSPILIRGADEDRWREELEPRLKYLLDAKLARQGKGRYTPRTSEQMSAGLAALLLAKGETRAPRNVRRMGGGASKEQFVFELDGDATGGAEKFVLRMDPLEGIIETCRKRESQVLRAVHGVVPVPHVAFVDGDGAYMGQPAMVTRFVGGVTKPSAGGTGPSGVGIILGDRISEALAPQYVENLAAVHRVAFSPETLPDYAAPRPGTTDAALWQINYWSRVRTDDFIDASPLLALTETWLRARLPVCENPVLLHGDYRLGNFMFDESTLKMTAILDWELSHIGDVHEDLAYSLEPLFGNRDAQGRPLVATMMTGDEFLRRYEQITGFCVNRETLHWYRVLTSYKLIVMNVTSSPRAARDGTNHQNALLGYLAACAVGMSETLCRLLAGEEV